MTAPSFDTGYLSAAFARLVPGWPRARLAVALSGGLDSVALLHATEALCRAEPGIALRALHVDHGLQPESGSWAAHCRALCAGLSLPLTVIELGLRPAAGASVEAAARSARYAALAAALAPGECLLTAQHADDQLETLLLQLFRGAGVAGLAAMPAAAPLGPGLQLRPLLDVPRAALLAYATGAGLGWVEDPMNADTRYDRAWLRREVLPGVLARWPAAAQTVGRSAALLGEAQALLEGLADADLAGLLDGERLRADALAALPRARQANALRRWLAGQGLTVPSAARLAAIQDDLLPAREDAMPLVAWPGGEVRRYRDRLYAMAPLGPVPDPDWQGSLRLGEPLALPCGLGSLALQPRTGEGIAAAALDGPLTVRFRQGGERVRLAADRPAKPLKQWWQETGVEPWRRGRLPLIYAGERLLAVAGWGVAAEAAAAPGEPGYWPCVTPESAAPAG